MKERIRSRASHPALPFVMAVWVVATLWPARATAMHIMEGFLPPTWCIAWGLLSLPFVVLGAVRISKLINQNPRLKMLIALVGAYAFVLSALKIPSVTGSCSHPTGVGLGAVIFGPFVMAAIGVIVLLFQALLLAHGGLTTLGANTFSMAVVGPLVSFGLYWLIAKKFKKSDKVAVFIATFLGSLATYIVTSFQLAAAFPSDIGGFVSSFIKFAGIFAVTQLPLSVIEGLISMLIFTYIKKYNRPELEELGVVPALDTAGTEAEQVSK